MSPYMTMVVLLVAVAVLQPQAPVPADPNARFMALATDFIHASLAMVPSNASAAGYHEHRDAKTGKSIQLDAVLDDLSAEGFAVQERFYREWRTRFAETPKQQLGPQEAADWQLIDDQIALQLLEYERIQNTKHNPTGQVEAIGNALFLPLTQEYAPKETRLAHILSRLEQVPRALEQARGILVDADPIFIKVAVEENKGNIDLIEHTIREAIPNGSPLKARYDRAAAPAIAAITRFNTWLASDLAARKTDRTWRLGKELYDLKFKYSLGASSTPEQVLADAESELVRTRAEMMQLALPLHSQWFPSHGEHSDKAGEDRENAVLGEVLQRISDEHPPRAELLESVGADLQGIMRFIRDHKIVSLSPRDNLRVIPTPPFMRGIYSVAGFHGAPPLEPTAEAEVLGDADRSRHARREGGVEAARVQPLDAALADDPRGTAGTLHPGRARQRDPAGRAEAAAQPVREWRQRGRLGGIHRRCDGERRLCGSRSAIPDQPQEGVAARSRELDPGREAPHDGHVRSRGARPDGDSAAFRHRPRRKARCSAPN